LRDTAHLSMSEDGAYRRLLDAYYIRETPLPQKISDVMRLVRAQNKSDRDATETVLREFFTETTDGWTHSRCEQEIARFQGKRAKAKSAAESRWDACGRNADAMQTHSERNADGMPRARVPDSSHQSPDTKKKASGLLTHAELVGQGVDEKVARDWLIIRKAQRAPLTETAWDTIKAEAAKANLSVGEAVKASVDRGWRGFKAEWLNDKKTGAPSSNSEMQDLFRRSL
jgi:uncharacterized protein YdaU (DUF1376 family)